jgi:peptide chain release factor 3
MSSNRRTFAIISHPDAGKTTLTEKFLLYGGALNLAGAVRNRKNEQATASDWMELEKKRGISVSSTVLQFDYRGYAINLLDTPGHRDFSEDTYRVLTAVDSVVMVLDAGKGIEEQTLKLFEVCRSKGTPIFTFINKCDRPGKDPLSLLDEIESTLKLQTYPITWPVGGGPDFKGVYDRVSGKMHAFERVTGGRYRAPLTVADWDDLGDTVPAALRDQAREELAMLDAAGAGFDQEAVLKGTMTPVYFGSAMHNFGVELLLNGFLDYAPPPQPRQAVDRLIKPEDAPFSAFIFKIQANMDPNHRDRLAFLRICSGRFQRNMQVTHAQGGKKMRLAFSHQLFGRERETMDEAWPGDILGVTGQGGFSIGDTLTEDASILYPPIPHFAPECFAYIHNTDSSDVKRFRSGLSQLLQEKVIQRITLIDSVSSVPLLGAVGQLQFDVVASRLEQEYGTSVRIEPAPWKAARWLARDMTPDKVPPLTRNALGRDGNDRLMILFESDWHMGYFMRENPSLKLFKSGDADA